jgi:integrase
VHRPARDGASGHGPFYSFEEFEALVAAARRVSLVAELVVLIGTRKADEVLTRDNGSPFRESHMADLLIKVAREAGMPPNGPHTLRHRFCSHLAMRGAAVGRNRPEVWTLWRRRLSSAA